MNERRTWNIVLVNCKKLEVITIFLIFSWPLLISKIYLLFFMTAIPRSWRRRLAKTFLIHNNLNLYWKIDKYSRKNTVGNEKFEINLFAADISKRGIHEIIDFFAPQKWLMNWNWFAFIIDNYLFFAAILLNYSH